MNRDIETLRDARQNIFSLSRELNIDQLNEIPGGFNNNIAWNLGHVIFAMQGVCYLRAGLPQTIDEKYYAAYKPDTKPRQYVNNKELEEMKELSLFTLKQLEIDYENNIFTNYTSWTTRYGVTLNNIDEAIHFLLFHEGLHTGYIMALKRFVKNRVMSRQSTL